MIYLKHTKQSLYPEKEKIMNEKTLSDNEIFYCDEPDEDIHRVRYEKKRHWGNGLHIAAYSSNEFGSLCHYHVEFELVLITEGEIHLLVNNEFLKLKAGEAAFVDKNLVHHLDYDVRMRTLENRYYSVVFGDDFLGENVSAEFLRQYTFNARLRISEAAAEAIKDIYRALRERPAEFSFLAQGRLAAVLCELIATGQYAERKHSEMTDSVNAIAVLISYIQENYQKKLTIEELADLVNYSVNYVSRLFKKHCGVNTVEYINRVRLSCVCHELVNTDKKISEIAADSGFSNVSYLNRTFLKLFGCTPHEYRKKVKGKN